MNSHRTRRHSTQVVLALQALLIACAGVPTPSPAPPIASAESLPPQQRGRLLVERSVNVLGGREFTVELAGYQLVTENRARRGNWIQARDWKDTTPNPIPTIVNFLVDLERGRVLHEFLSTSPGPIQFNYRSRYDTTGVWQVDLLRWRTGNDLVRAAGAAGRANLAANERLLPHGALRQALLRGDSLIFREQKMQGAKRVDVVSFREQRTGERVDLSLDAETALPVAVTSGATTWEFDDYRVLDKTRVPYVRRLLNNGIALQEFRITRVDLRPILSDDRFLPPTGFVAAPAPGTPRATRVANGIYRFDNMPGDYHAAFVVREQDVVVLEAPFDVAFTRAALRLIGETAPDRPITRVFVSHHHGDHVGGLAPYVSRGATLVVGAGLEEAIRRQLPDSLRARATFDPVDAVRRFGAGAGAVHAYPVPNGHAGGALAFHMPSERVLMQGDLFYIPERGTVPPAFTVTDALVKVVNDAGLQVDHVIGVHGRTGTWAEVLESLRKRAGAPKR